MYRLHCAQHSQPIPGVVVTLLLLACLLVGCRPAEQAIPTPAVPVATAPTATSPVQMVNGCGRSDGRELLFDEAGTSIAIPPPAGWHSSPIPATEAGLPWSEADVTLHWCAQRLSESAGARRQLTLLVGSTPRAGLRLDQVHGGVVQQLRARPDIAVTAAAIVRIEQTPGIPVSAVRFQAFPSGGDSSSAVSTVHYVLMDPAAEQIRMLSLASEAVGFDQMDDMAVPMVRSLMYTLHGPSTTHLPMPPLRPLPETASLQEATPAQEAGNAVSAARGQRGLVEQTDPDTPDPPAQ